VTTTPPKPEKPQKITRETLRNGLVARMATERDGENTIVASDDDLLRSRQQFIPDDYDCDDIWIFGYGSLIFNPVMKHSERLFARVYGHHRRFCLWTKIGRGSPEFPGLVLALDKGGSCPGVAFKLPCDLAIAEIDLLWKREMITLAYRPTWLKLHTANGIKRGIGFVANPDRPVFAPHMTHDEIAHVIANAEGFLGPCHDYLFNTLHGLQKLGISDPTLEKLAAKVEHKLASPDHIR
jgi:glutathione-specific gamma-glutamylcyclotransferase